MIRLGWLRVPVLVLMLVLVALPALAGERPARLSEEPGLLRASVEAVACLVPSGSVFKAVLSALWAPAVPGEEDPDGANTPDLGPGLDPMG
jgi:hypothetical protein